jgi:hypothetical protein
MRMAKMLASDKLARRSTGSNEVDGWETDIGSADCPALEQVFAAVKGVFGSFLLTAEKNYFRFK